MRSIFIISVLALSSFSSSAQSGAVDSVKATILNMFAAMKLADGNMLSAQFADSAVLQTMGKNKEGKLIVKNEKVSDFAAMLTKQEKGALDEQITFDVVRVDADLAIAWTPYKFYFKEKFSHCGVNSFQLVRVNNIWKIQYLIDTRRRAGCEQ